MTADKSPNPTPETAADQSALETTQSAVGQPRRNFILEVLAVAVGGIVGLAPLAVGGITFLDPLFRKKKGASDFKRVASLDQIPKDGTPINVPVLADKVDVWTVESGQPIGAVYLRREGENGEKVVCFNAVCPHAGCMVAYSGDQSKFLCPCHNSSFGLDGEKIDLPGKTNPSPRPMDTLEVDEEKVKEDGEVWIKFENFYPGKHEKIAKT